uniref:Uncharacterized protein n=1 Tax=Noccaea caerulescens TaxID=107243 RepID=A0A1J3J3S4_NOCCA
MICDMIGPGLGQVNHQKQAGLVLSRDRVHAAESRAVCNTKSPWASFPRLADTSWEKKSFSLMVDQNGLNPLRRDE